ncbi:transcription antitermination factor NusB [Paenibacillus sp. JSM ZJ436]|uniref:transcription antitermination factor NusB n=1 Tax=Paenibacillus sp. JSM ZJ436 TaxID=3376190 RepID=UPI003791D86B
MKRRVIREIAVQSLYQMEMNDVQSGEAVAMLLSEAAEENETERSIDGDEDSVRDTLLQLVNGCWKVKDSVDGVLTDYLKGWQVSRLSRVDRQILRLAVYEMVYRDDVPGKVAVNEAIELSKHFGTEESGKFVNGVLGKMLQDLEQVTARLEGFAE